MVYIHELPNWPAFTWDEARLTHALADIRHGQGWLIGAMEALGFPFRAEASLQMLTSEVIKSSAIEGEVLDSEEVRSSIARKLGLESGGLVPASRAVEGIVEVVLDATRYYDRPLTATRLCSWHAALFPAGTSGMRKITVGAWRPETAGTMQVVSGPLGHEHVHFEAPAAVRLDAEMARFLEWFEGDVKMNPVLKAGLAHFWFVTIHPFEDGNGRIARAIADLALARADGSAGRFYSMSSQIEAERNDYYRVLERQQRSDLDVTPWLDWFLGCLGRALDNAQDAVGMILYKARLWECANRHPVNDRQRTVVNRMLDGFKGHMTTSKYAKLAKTSTDTALRDINSLVEWGILVRNSGKGRSTSYRLVSPREIEALQTEDRP